MLRGLLDSPGQLLIVLLVLVLLFGSRRMPDAARGLGRSLRIFKSEVKAMSDDDPKHASRRETRPGGEALEGRVVEEERPVRPTHASDPERER